MHGVVLSQDRQPRAALNVGEVISVVETAERVEGCNGEAVLLPLCLQDIEAGRAARHEDVALDFGPLSEIKTVQSV